MTREEMINVLYDYCKHRPHTVGCCLSCPIRKPFSNGNICQAFSSRSEEELVEAVEIITMAEGNKETAYSDKDCQSVANDVTQPDRQMVEISRDEMRMFEGRLLMLASCTGATITNAMANELLFMVETIENALKESEDILG